MKTAEEILKGYTASIQYGGYGYSESEMEDAVNDAIEESEGVIQELVASLEDLWLKSTNLFGELSMDEVGSNSDLLALSKSIDNAKSIIEKVK